MKFLVFIFIVAYLLHEDVEAWRSFEFNFINIECVKKSQIASFVNCSLSKLSHQEKGLCFTLEISQEVKKPMLDFLIETTRQNQPNFVLANLTRLDGCQFFENRGIVNIIKIVRENFDKFANMPKKCPVAKDTILYVKDLRLDPNNFPPYVPETTFVVTVKLWEEIIPVFEVIVKGNVKARGRKVRLSLKSKT